MNTMTNTIENNNVTYTNSSSSNTLVQEITVSNIGAINSAMVDISKQLYGTNTSIMLKVNFAQGFVPTSYTGLNILMSYKKEGGWGATITAASSTLVALAITAAAIPEIGATAGVILAANIVGGAAGFLVDKMLDKIYGDLNFKEEMDIFWDNKFGKAVVDTSVSNLNDIKGLVSPLYSSAADCDLNEIEVRVKPQNEGYEPLVYEIKPGDTVWDLCQKYDVTYEILFEFNPWLRDRFSDDMKFALIKPGEILRIPLKDSMLSGSRPTFDIPFNTATTVGTVVYDPILLDLDGDGIKTTSVRDGVYFDHQGDGFAESSAWVDKNDGILIIDKNGDGVINDGGEVFGDNYVKSNGNKASSGFDALKNIA